MTRYCISVQEFHGDALDSLGPPIHGQVVNSEEDISQIWGYLRFLKQASDEFGSFILDFDDSGEPIRVRDREPK